MLDRLIAKTVYILRELRANYSSPVFMWAGGKDSTSLLYLARMAYLNDIPFPVAFIDTGYQFKETYNFISRIKELWNLNLLVLENREAKMQMVSPETHSAVECCTLLKTDALLNAIRKHKFDCVVEATRWDEHPIRSKRKYFVEQFNPPHTRAYPINHFTEEDIWQLIKTYNIPYNPLYTYELENDKMYRSIGCYPCTKPVKLTEKERAGRTSTKEELLEYLTKLGYL